MGTFTLPIAYAARGRALYATFLLALKVCFQFCELKSMLGLQSRTSLPRRSLSSPDRLEYSIEVAFWLLEES